MNKSNQNEDIIIEPLSKKTINGALKVLDKVFGNNLKDKVIYHNAFIGSLDMNKYKLIYGKKEKPSYLQYYVARDKESGRIFGTTGLYVNSELDTGRIGIGWFCVDPKFRGKGIGKALLDFTIEKARERRSPVLFLWTTSDPAERLAHKMYARRGFRVIKREKSPRDKYEVISMELKL